MEIEQSNKSVQFSTATVILSLLLGLFGGYAGGIAAQKNSGSVGVGPQELRQQVSVTEDSAVIDVVKKASPAVVSIVVTKEVAVQSQVMVDPFGFQDDLFSQFFGQRQVPRQPQAPGRTEKRQVGAGSGFFISADGLLLTNRHVVGDEQSIYTVTTGDGKRYDAEVVARDPYNDIAIMRAKVSGNPYLDLASGETLQTGQRVVAIGYSLGQYQNTVTTGVVSGIGRSITAGGGGSSEQLEGVIQTDAAINPGNSGGPLLNLSGQVVGINTAIDRGGQSVGFAIPAADASRAVLSFQKNGKITRTFLGVRYLVITEGYAKDQKLPKDYGALVLRGETQQDLAVVPGSPADKAGLKENDIILEVDGKKVSAEQTLAGLLKKYAPGDRALLTVYSGGAEKKVQVTLEEQK